MSDNKKKGDSLPKRSIKAVKVNGTEERYKPTRHYVSILVRAMCTKFPVISES